MLTKSPDLTWDIDIPLVTNPLILKAWVMAMGVTYLLVMLILGAVFIGSGQGDQLPLLAVIFAVGVGVLTLLGMLVMLLVFGNRYRARFTVSEKGVVYEGLDNRARTLARLAVIAGAVGGSTHTAGAGLLAISQESMALNWSGAFTARNRPQRHTIVLRNQWRDVMHIYCTTSNYNEIRDRVAQELDRHATQKRLSTRPSPLPGALLRTAAVVLACLPLFALQELTKLELFVPLLMMVFALTIVWLIPLFAWVVLPLVVYIAIHLAMFLGKLREHTLITTYIYRKYEVLHYDEWILLGAALLGLTYLGWISIRALRGQLQPVLFQDMESMEN